MVVTPIVVIDATGAHRPDLATCINYFVNAYQQIYGTDAYLGSDSQDGELLGLLGAALDDVNGECVAAYNAYSPATAMGVGLDANVKINGIRRKSPTFSTAPVLCVGPFGTTVNGGIIGDAAGNSWTLPNFTIDISGQIVVTATCLVPGAILAPIGSINQIKTQTFGWQSVSNTAAAVPGAPVETDPQLKARQAVSTMQPAASPFEAVQANVWALPAIIRMQGYENVTNAPDANGIPGHSIAIVVDGGDALSVAQAISGKSGGCGTYGSTNQTLVDKFGIPHAIAFSYVIEPPVTYGLTIRALNGFSLNSVALIQQAVSDYTNSLKIGAAVQLNRVFAAAYLQPSVAPAVSTLAAAVASGVQTDITAAMAALTAINTAKDTYEITLLKAARDGGVLGTIDIPIAFNEAAFCVPANVAVAVV